VNATDPTDHVPARPASLPVLLCLLAAALSGVGWRVWTAWQGVDWFSDDAYYYTVIARNFVDSGRFTFDGLSETNGFHPLLFWVEVAGFAVFGTDASPRNQYLVIYGGMAAVFLATLGVAVCVASRRVRCEDDAVLAGSVLLTLGVTLAPRFTSPYLGGMEAILVLPLLMLVAGLAWKARYAAAGIAALLLVMARLDTLPYVVLPMGLACAWRERSRAGSAFRSAVWMVSPAVAGTAVLMAWCQWSWGNPMPIHAVLKTSFPKIHFQWQQLLGGAFFSATLLYALLAAAGGACLVLRQGHCGRQVRGAGITAAVLGLIQLAAFALFQKWSKPVPDWYLGPAVLTGTFALAVGLVNTIGLRGFRALVMVAAVAALAANLRLVVLHRDRGSTDEKTARLAEIVDFMKTRPPEEIWACTDCGKLAFWSRRPVVNLDGLVNDFAYQAALRDGRLAEYLRRSNVKYLVFLAWDRPQVEQGVYEPMYECRVAPEVFSGETTEQADYQAAEFYVYSYQYGRESDRVRLPRSAEIWRSAAARDGRARDRAVIFDLERALP